MPRPLALLAAALLSLAPVMPAPAVAVPYIPWFANSVGSAAQVVAVNGAGGSTAKIDVFQRAGDQWTAVSTGIPAHVGSAGFAPQAKSEYPATPNGIYSLDYAFGTAPPPSTGLKYVQIGTNDWWDGDGKSPTFNTMQRCVKAACPFDTSAGENLNIPQYKHAIVMGVNKAKIPEGGSAFFVHSSDGGPTAGCVSLDDGTLVQLIGWLRPGAVIAIKG
jgi:L,D-peptidoglycan transpeptidase YkuD (ErfK/YbiS/YcfS/YnhG family)